MSELASEFFVERSFPESLASKPQLSEQNYPRASSSRTHTTTPPRAQTGVMSESTSTSKSTGAFFVQAAIAFGVSLFGTGIGVFYLPLDAWQRGFLGMTMLFLVTSSFTLAKVVRDQQEASTVRVRLDEARMEKLIADHDPYRSVA